ncbi:hypothetical protein [Verrucomicrobium spinosum]|uniref:hypothetical protein n=1 Tax=Verrucomicrobium spinosum TaxID=2736 RepID=UPI000174496D|nr:hypothetical protein [Verrucomicrobium spinosum]
MRIYTIIFTNGDRKIYQADRHVTGRDAFVLLRQNGERLSFAMKNLRGWQLVSTSTPAGQPVG